MLDPDLPLTRVEYHQRGNPRENEEAYGYISSYAPYDNISHQLDTRKCDVGNKSSILVTAAMQDQRVPYWHPLKWVARMRARQSNFYFPSSGNEDNLLILKTDLEKGHFGGGRNHREKIKDLAFELAFLVSRVQPE
ncbi:3540_t:CDS:1, partial [Acaulospora morrowiae]